MMVKPRSTVLAVLLLSLPATLATVTVEAQEGKRRNLFGMHNLKDGGPAFDEGMEWTGHLVGQGFVFDWVFDFDPWIDKAFRLNLVPCIRVQEGRGGAAPDPGYARNVAWSILNYKIAHPEFAERLVYLQLWNEPNDPRDHVTPEVYADYVVAAHGAVHQAEADAAARHPNLALRGTLKTMTPGQNGPSWWDRAFRHNPDAKFAFDVWGTHPYPEATPPHYNLHDGDVFIETSKTVDSYLMDLDVVARPHGSPARSRRGFPVMITETAYGNKLGISYEGWPKTNRPLAAAYNVDAFKNRWYRWPEILAVHPFLLSNLSWRDFEWVRGHRSDDDDGDGVREPEPGAAHPQYDAVRALRLDLETQGMAPARRTPYRGAAGSFRGRITRADTGSVLPYVTLRTDGYEFGHVSLYDGVYEIKDVPPGTYTLTAEKNGYRAASQTLGVAAGQTLAADFSLVPTGRTSRGLYFVDSFAGHGGCSGCSLFDRVLGQTFRVPEGVGFIKYAAAKPYVDGVTLKFSILEGGPNGPQVGTSIGAVLEPGDGAIMIGAEWPDGQEPAVRPGGTYFLKIERADGQGIYCYASGGNPYGEGKAYVGGQPRDNVDFYGVIRGLTDQVNTATGALTGVVEDTGNAPLAGAVVTVDAFGQSSTADGSGAYRFSAIPAGTYRVSASRAGYETESVDGVPILENEVTTVDFTLMPAPPAPNVPPTAAASASPTSGVAPLAVVLDGRSSSDPEGRALRYDWDFGDGSPKGSAPQLSHTFSNPGSYTVTLSVDDGDGGHDSDSLLITVTMPAVSLITNGDFANGLAGWSVWTERGTLNARTENGQLRLGSANHNGGVYQRFGTGGRGAQISISGFWASDPTVARSQWAEVLVINGPRQPVNFQDVNAGQSDVVLLYKNDTWASPTGWSGEMGLTAPVARRTSFVAAESVATIVLKSGNAAGPLTGTRFDDVVVGALKPPPNRPPTATATASPTAGVAPLPVSFDGSGSIDPDGDPLSFSWDFGDGQGSAGRTLSHDYTSAGSFTAKLTVGDGKGGSGTASVTIVVQSSPPPPPPPSGVYGITVHPPPSVVAGERWFQLVKLRHLGCQENGGKHNLFTAFFYLSGARVEQGFQNRVGWKKSETIAGELPLEKNELTGGDPIHGNLDLYFFDNASLEYLRLNGSSAKIQRISGVHTRHPDECAGNTAGHHSFVAVYQERLGPEQP